MKVRFCPESIYDNFSMLSRYPRYIEREMEFLPPKDIDIYDLSLAGKDSFIGLLQNYDYDTLIEMATYRNFEDFGYSNEQCKEMTSMTKEKFIEDLWDNAFGYRWRVKEMFYDISENVYYCIVALNL